MAQGRFMWGVGSGGFIGDFRVAGVDPATGEQRGLTRESVDLVLKLWEDPTPGEYSHRRWEFNVPEPDDEIGLRVHVKPYQKPHPPIAMAGISVNSDTLELAGERGWIPMSINFAPKRVLKTHWTSVEEGAARSGRTADRADWRVAREIFVAETTKGPGARRSKACSPGTSSSTSGCSSPREGEWASSKRTPTCRTPT